jgi:hypothetical protein
LVGEEKQLVMVIDGHNILQKIFVLEASSCLACESVSAVSVLAKQPA